MKPTSNHHDIVEKLLLLVVIIVAVALSCYGGEVFRHLETSTRLERIVAMPGIDGSLILGSGYSQADTMAAVYVGGFLTYFFAGLALLSLAQDRYKKSKSGSSSTII
jgi:hypothetical protein